jgi:NADPH:quinone reductase-like Zn-dependent oxidoreductase
MKAAVVTTFGEPPRYADAPDPVANGPDEVVVDVLAAALSPRVRSQAAGTHYTSNDQLPLIPGIDGVGRLPDGTVAYFLLPDTSRGAMAERTTVDRRRAVALPKDADPVKIAAIMNPAMASWVALRRRITFHSGQDVLILGATGNAGRCAVQVAKRLGAGRVVAVGRGMERVGDLTDLGASRIIELNGDPERVRCDLADAGRDVDVVLDFLWGDPARNALYAIIPHRARDEQTLTWIQIGAVAGAESAIPSAALRAVDLQIIGSGQGSVAPADYREEVAALAGEVLEGSFGMAVRQVPLSEVEAVWADSGRPERIVFTP